MQASLPFRSSNSWSHSPCNKNDARLPDLAYSGWCTVSPIDLMVEVTTSRASSLVRDPGASHNFHLSPAVGRIDVSGGYGSPQSLASCSPGQEPYELSSCHGIYDMSGLPPAWNFGQGLGLYDPSHILNVPTGGLPVNGRLQHYQHTDWTGHTSWQPGTQSSQYPPTHLTIGAGHGEPKAKKKLRGSRGTRHQTTSRRQHTKSSPMSMYALQEATIAHDARNEVHESSMTKFNKSSCSPEICICKWCQRALSGPRNLVRHVRTACKKSPFVKKKMPYQCHLCMYGTARLDNFKRHNCSRRKRKIVAT